MAMPVVFPTPRYHAAASHYLAGRPPYAPRLIAHVAGLTGLPRDGRLLDLGCGPGPLALAFSALAAEVLAVDPEPEMLRVARSTAGDAPILFQQGSSRDLGPAFGRFHLTVMGRSFQWMDRAETLRRLDGLIEPGGAVALFGDEHAEVPDNAWQAVWREVLGRYHNPGAGRPHRGPDWLRHEALLLDSAFSRLDRVTAIDRRRIPVAMLVERALSQSTHSRDQIGAQVETMARDIVDALGQFAVDGMITEAVETYALIASRGDTA
jgi:SAM-dependent methyltransferase